MRAGANRKGPSAAAIALAVTVHLALAAPALAIHGGSAREVVAGDVVPEAVKQAVGGGDVRIPAEEGITALLFWATWSPRSRDAIDLWEKFNRDYADDPLTVVTVNAERDELSVQDRDSINGYISSNIPNLTTIIDEGLELFNRYAVKALPTVFFLDSAGKVLHRYASFPSSAPLDLQEEIEIALGVRERQTEEQRASRGKLEYQPRNNALLHYNMAVQLYSKGYRDKALARFAVALQKDPEYPDPLRTLEGIFFEDGRSPESEGRLRAFLQEKGLQAQVERIGEGDPIVIQGPEKIGAMERMRKLMEKNNPARGASPQQGP